MDPNTDTILALDPGNFNTVPGWYEPGTRRTTFAGAQPSAAVLAHGITSEVVKLAAADKGFVLLPRR